MAALTTARKYTFGGDPQGVVTFQCSSLTAKQGSLIGLDRATGLAILWIGAAGDEFAGIAVASTSSASTIRVDTSARQVTGYETSSNGRDGGVNVTGSSADTNQGAKVYSSTDNLEDLTLTPTAGPHVGTVLNWISGTQCTVLVQPAVAEAGGASVGGYLDLNGVADGLILDADGDTTISSPTDDQIDFEVGGADAFRIFGATAVRPGIERQAGYSDNSHRNRVRIVEDFLGPAGTTLPAPWSTQDTSAAGTPTLDYVNDVQGGHFQITHDGTSEGQNLTLYFGDQLVIDPTKNPVFEARLLVNFAGATFTADQRIVIGLASARNATLDSVTHHAWFRIEGANLNILVEADDGTTDTDDQDSTIDIVDNTMTSFRIDMSDLSDIKYYVDGVEQGGATVAAAAMAAGNLLQPFIEIQRDAGTEAEDVRIDYVMVEYDR